MKLLFLSGSLRRGGSTEGVLRRCVEHLAATAPDVETDVVHLCERRIEMCDSCYQCEPRRACWRGDDVRDVVRRMMTADGVIYAFPVHAFGVNSLMQTFLERAGVGYLRFSRPLENKPAGIIVTGRRYGHEMAWSQVALNVMLNRMILLGTGFPGVVKNDGKRLADEVEDAEGLAATMDMLNKMVWFVGGRAAPRRLSVLPAAE